MPLPARRPHRSSTSRRCCPARSRPSFWRRRAPRSSRSRGRAARTCAASRRISERGSAPFAVLNGGKKSLVVDLKTEEGRAALRPLIERADVLVEQFRPGVMDRLGLGYDAVRTINPRIDLLLDHRATARTARARRRPATTSTIRPSPACCSCRPARRSHRRAGRARRRHRRRIACRPSSTSCWRCASATSPARAAISTSRWRTPCSPSPGTRSSKVLRPAVSQDRSENMLAGGSPRYALYATADDRLLAVGALEQKFWDAFCEGIALPSPLRDDGAEAGGDPGGGRHDHPRPHGGRVEGDPAAARLLRHRDRFAASRRRRSPFPGARPVSGAGHRCLGPAPAGS